MTMKVFALPMSKLIQKSQNAADVPKLAASRNMLVTNIKMKDGSVVKLFEGADEIDVICANNGKIISAHGIIEHDAEKNSKILSKIYKIIDKRKDIIQKVEPVGFNYTI